MRLLFLIFFLVTSVDAATVANITKFSNHTPKEKARNELALVKIRETVSGECFKSAWLKRALIQANGKSNQFVLDDLIAANVPIELEMYRSWKRVNGYTYENVKKIWLNRKYHDYYGACSVANNLFHEISHKIGYSHDYRPSKQRQYSVPYSINAIMEICCKDSI